MGNNKIGIPCKETHEALSKLPRLDPKTLMRIVDDALKDVSWYKFKPIVENDMTLLHQVIEKEQELEQLVKSGHIRDFDFTDSYEDDSGIHLNVKLGPRLVKHIRFRVNLKHTGAEFSGVMNDV